MKSRLDKAIADFEDETLDLTLGERIANIREALIWNAHEVLKKISSGSKRHRKSKNDELDDFEKEEYKQTQCFKWFREIEKLYASQLKMNKLTGKSEDAMDKDFLRKIKELKSSIGDIVVRIPITKTEYNN